jgi:alanine racemase
MSDLAPNAWVSVSRAALRHNFQALRTELARSSEKPPQIIAVVKADAFGHGMAEAARVFAETGADFFAVTTPAEALTLREGDIAAPILVFLPPLPDQVNALVDADMDLTVMEDAGLAQIAASAQRLGKKARVHLKVDTGMGRIGVLPENALALAQMISGEPNIIFAGIYTHFAHALDRDPAPTQRQFQTFQQILQQLTDAGIDPGLRHCANSAAILRFPEMRLDAVRPGTILYGQRPSASVPRTLELQDGWRLQARVIAVRDVPTGTAIGYGGEFVTRRPTQIAVLPIGYADGFTVAPASASAGWRGIKALVREILGRGPGIAVTLHGKRAPIIGRVSMQISTVDVTDIPGIVPGDIATVPARRITASARLPRVYED